jgi:hypothetical protein
MDGSRSSLKPMFKREREEINEWIQKLSKTHFKREGEERNGWFISTQNPC